MSAGLQYPPGFIDHLPVIVPRPAPNSPVRAITASQFLSLHSRHTLAADSKDSLLFPYLHGLEGRNQAQNAFFTSPETTVGPTKPASQKCAIPDYRGLMWVAADDSDADDDDEMLWEDDEFTRQPSDTTSLASTDSSLSLVSNLTCTPSMYSRTSIAENPYPVPAPPSPPTYISCSFKSHELLSPTSPTFLPLNVPDGISLRNFGIQTSVYARISDIVVYSPTGQSTSRAVLALAERFKIAHETLAASRPDTAPSYNVFVLMAPPSSLPPYIITHPPPLALAEKAEMHALTRSSEILPGIFLGNAADVPCWSDQEPMTNVFDSSNNPDGYDLCVQCHDGASIPSSQHIRRAEEHLQTLSALWQTGFTSVPPSRPPPNAQSILHLPFPSSPSLQTNPIPAITTFLTFIQSLIHASRRSKVLIYSQDGYTESSVLALSLIMAEKRCSLPEAYLELQNRRHRSFFVYESDLAILRRVEQKYCTPQSVGRSRERGDRDRWPWSNFGRNNNNASPVPAGDAPSSPPSSKVGRSSRNHSSSLPVLPHGADHYSWMNNPRFDGSLPSRVLPFLYLGNLNHACNAYMLHALGITHVVSVGESALIPDEPSSPAPSGKPHGAGTLWLEEREGRIKNVSDDGIDSLRLQLRSICEWIDRARVDGGKVLVHCRVGVSRSATVTIAYLMKFLQLPLLHAYLVVRARRLSVLIQPNLRLLYNLLGWEVELARERLQTHLSLSLHQALTWPYLAREIHNLNAKYMP
ncbi:hypothetical protein SISSUDRAFT_980478 [Sistotremastrum suecicum HHB10207 ss-3]|uniref:Uncharacterized protein n=1 Tax=Sistotremastrum suecicum HHB10207 ss-3 TaxID=1314776 RepID=A0A166H050_9AGAM|nr:hypothetical protein SISSUDRAFT_980478 [Sistotremastrum suecicum HHB10207 ss-3]